MKKTLFTAVIMSAVAITLNFTAITTLANCHCDCPQKPERPPFKEKCDRPSSMDEHAKMKEQKKIEFHERLKLTDAQKAKLEQIKADEKKALAPYKAKIDKEQAKIEELFEKEKAIRDESMKKFEAILSDEQKAELEKIKKEIKDEMEKFSPKRPPHHPKFESEQTCPPDYGCHCQRDSMKK